MPIIVSAGTAVPPYRVDQDTSREFARNLFANSFRDIERLLTVFESAQVEKRHFCAPPSWFEQAHSFPEKNQMYIENGLKLSSEAIRNCLDQAGLAPTDPDILVFVSTTGVSTPSLDAMLFNELGLRQDIKRIPIWGLGCAGGASGLARGMELARAYPDAKIVVCCLELCGLTFLHNDRSKSNLIATSLFADGAAAVLIMGDGVAEKTGHKGPRMLTAKSTIWPDSLDVMGWDLEEDGLKVIFSKDIPTLVANQIRPEVEAMLSEVGIALGDLDRFIAHPGGMKVLQAYQEALNLRKEMLDHSRDVLREHGNMSSCTVFFVLARELQESHNPGEYGLIMALGPGFSCEQVMVQW
jgi:alkylresorcinol/alkylpyrone synthase